MSHAKRIPSLDGLRGIASIAVVFFHFNIFFLPQAGLPFLGRAYLAVDLFFLLSGFVMAHVYGRELASDWAAHWKEFAIARFARIYPLFTLTTLAMVVVFALSGGQLIYVSLSNRTLALQPFLLQYLASGLSWNYPSWSIGTECLVYIFFVFMAGPLLTGRYPRLIAAGCAATLAGLSYSNSWSLNLFVGSAAVLRTLTEFSLGVLLYRANLGGEGVLRKRAAGLAILFL